MLPGVLHITSEVCSCSARHLTCRGKGGLLQNPSLLSAAATICAAHVNMSRLRFSVLLGVILLLATASAASSSSGPPEAVHRVVGHEVLGSYDGSGNQTLSEWAMTQRFYVGGFLEFKLATNDSLLLVRRADYERCGAASPLRRFWDGGDTRFTFDRPEVFYFISATPARCEAGERMVVRVVDPLNISGGAAPTPAPAPGPESAVRRRRPLTIVEKQMVAGALGFAAGFVTTFLIVAFFVCCPRC